MKPSALAEIKPSGLDSIREEAWAAFQKSRAPEKTTETWRRMRSDRWRLAELLGKDRPSGTPSTDAPSALGEASGVFTQDMERLPFKLVLDPELARKGVVLTTIEQALAEQPRLVEHTLARSLASPDFEQFEAANLGGFTGGAFLFVPPGVKVEKPFDITFMHLSPGFAFPRTLVVLGDGAEASVVEDHCGGLPPTAPVSSVAFSSVSVGAGAKLRYFFTENLAMGASHFWHQHVALAGGALLQHYSVLVGAAFQKSQLDVELLGAGARSELYGLLFGSENQFFDPHTSQLHRAGHTDSDLLFKVALQERARSIYTGLIRVEKDALQANAYQQNNNLLLSDTARADTTPVLEILTDQVHCKHGATMGPVGDEELFYLGTRGLDPKEATRLLIRGFFDPILRHLPLERLKERLAEDIERRLTP